MTTITKTFDQKLYESVKNLELLGKIAENSKPNLPREFDLEKFIGGTVTKTDDTIVFSKPAKAQEGRECVRKQDTIVLNFSTGRISGDYFYQNPARPARIIGYENDAGYFEYPIATFSYRSCANSLNVNGLNTSAYNLNVANALLLDGILFGWTERSLEIAYSEAAFAQTMGLELMCKAEVK